MTSKYQRLTLIPLLLVFTLASLGLGQKSTQKQPFTIAVITEKAAVKEASGVLIRIRLTNNSKHDLDTSANISDLTGVDPNYQYDVRDSTGNSVPKRVYEHPELATGHAIFGSVKPGESTVLVQDISRLLDMTHPGIYTLQISRHFSPDNEGAVVKSNKITVAVSQ